MNETETITAIACSQFTDEQVNVGADFVKRMRAVLNTGGYEYKAYAVDYNTWDTTEQITIQLNEKTKVKIQMVVSK